MTYEEVEQLTERMKIWEGRPVLASDIVFPGYDWAGYYPMAKLDDQGTLVYTGTVYDARYPVEGDGVEIDEQLQVAVKCQREFFANED